MFVQVVDGESWLLTISITVSRENTKNFTVKREEETGA
jgi:hypothetical protein